MTIRGVADREAQTSAAGDFAFHDLPEGDYEISAELSGFERARRAVRVQAGERVTVSFTLHVAIVEETIVTAAKVGERDVQTIPMAISAVSNAELARLGTQTLGEAAALAPSVTFSQNTGFGQLTIRGIGANVRVRRVGSEFGDVSRRRLPRSTGDGVRAVSRSRSHRGASRTAGHLVWTQRGRWGDEPDIQAAHERLPGVRRSHRRELRRASRRRAGQRPAQARQSDGGGRVRAWRPGRLRPRPRASGPSAWRRRCHRGAGPAARGVRSPHESAAVERRRPPGRDSTDLQQGAGREAGISDRQPARSPRRSSIGARLESHAATTARARG